tara:strand:- start:661 stop:1476 length:816 start_codon:yes stop_codon:yes gene_type:complete
MQSIHATKRNIDIKEYRQRGASEEDFETLVTEDTVVYIDDHLVIAYFAPVKEQLTDLRQALQQIKYESSTRTSGLRTTSRIFGYAPRNVIRNHPCRLVSLATEFPVQHAIIEHGASIAASYYWIANPDLAGIHQQMTDEKLQREYVLANSMFTSGIVNENNPLMYHFDSGNYKGVYSAMFGFKQGIDKGYLSVPELNLGFGIADRSLLLFDGQGLLHGVTPIIKKNPNAKRYSIVYYSLQQMWNCKAPGEELERLRERRTKMEQRKANSMR